MAARFDHLVIAVADLDEAAARWGAAGLAAQLGGAHPTGTANVLVRGPEPAYVELIAPSPSRGPIAWAIAVDDIDAARSALVEAGLDPDPVVRGSRRTLDGTLVEWRVCEVSPYDGGLPFLIEWTSPMAPGPADGPIVAYVTMTPRDPEAAADLLLAVGFVASSHWPRRMFHDPSGGGVGISLLPIGEPEVGDADWTMSWESSDEPAVSVTLTLPESEFRTTELDGVTIGLLHDRRRFVATSLLPAVDDAFAHLRGDLADWPNPHPGGASPAEHEYSRVSDPERYRLLGVRADAWVQAITAAGLGVAETPEPVAVEWMGEQYLSPSRVTVVRGRDGTQPIVVAWAPSPSAEEANIQIGVGEPAHLLERQPTCGCDACDTGSVDLLETVDSGFILALSGGVYSVRRGDMVVTRHLDGWGGQGNFADGEAQRWLEDAAAGRRTDGALIGEPWL